MGEQTSATLNHFSLLKFKREFWADGSVDRRQLGSDLTAALRSVTPAIHLYQVFPTESDSDLLVWSAVEGAEKESGARFFKAFSQAVRRYRRYIEFRDILWGFTRPSQYTKVRSTQEIDPFSEKRSPYLIVYPFVKTAEWYLLSLEERQTMMNEHIQVGKQYKDVTQLLLYSFGLQDQEFVVVYETDDLNRFSQLVHELRATEGRNYTERDAPLHTGVHLDAAEIESFWQ